MWLHAITVFVGAFLLFQVQPLIAKFILPWFGGSAAVWTTCMLFFQVFLVAGYAYAHATCRWLSPRSQAWLHIVFVLAAMAMLPIVPAAAWEPAARTEPIGHILLLLTVCLGLPYFVLASTGPLVQAWFAKQVPGESPYRLYALSNVGSFLALLSFPFVVEPMLTRQSQAAMWGWGFVIYAVLATVCGLWQWRATGARNKPNAKKPRASRSTMARGIPQLLHEPSPGHPRPTSDTSDASMPHGSRADVFLWLMFPACGTVLLLATNNKLCQEVAAVPFLWVLPLAIYLLTFVICFERPAWYARTVFTWLLVPALGAWCYALFSQATMPIEAQVVISCIGLFVACMVCHGEVYRLRPPPQSLTGFYLMIAIGGALGGFAVAVLAPLVLRLYSELHWGLMLLVALVAWVHFRDRSAWVIDGRRLPVWPGVLAGLIVLAGGLIYHLQTGMEGVVRASRNFYGVLRVVEIERDDPDYHARMLIHGTTNHGLEFLSPEKSNLPTMYFNPPSGVGLALDYARARGPLRIGVVGLGVGTLAAYGRPADTIRFYELDPDVVKLAQTQFGYLKRCKAKVEIILGDGRLSLEREEPQEFDVLVLDAFSGDSPPVHLLTREAFELYLRHVKPTGVIAVNTSNRYLDFFPVVLAAAEYHGVGMIFVPWNEKPMPLGYASSAWILVSRNKNFLYDEGMLSHASRPFRQSSLVPVPWTDDYASLFRILMR